MEEVNHDRIQAASLFFNSLLVHLSASRQGVAPAATCEFRRLAGVPCPHALISGRSLCSATPPPLGARRRAPQRRGVPGRREADRARGVRDRRRAGCAEEDRGRPRPRFHARRGACARAGRGDRFSRPCGQRRPVRHRLDPEATEALKERPDLLLTDLRSIAVQGLVGPDHLAPLAEAKAMLPGTRGIASAPIAARRPQSAGRLEARMPVLHGRNIFRAPTRS